MTSKKFKISQSEAIDMVLAGLDGPLSLDDFVDRVLDLWPSTAKSARNSTKQKIRWDYTGQSLLMLDNNTVIPTAMGLQGVRFRIPVSEILAEAGFLSVRPNFLGWLGPWEQPDGWHFLDEHGQAIPMQLRTRRVTIDDLIGPQTSEQLGFDLSGWQTAYALAPGDSLLLTITDWAERQFQLVHEPAATTCQHHTEIAQRNQQLTDMLYALLEASRDGQLYTTPAIRTVHAQQPDRTEYPGDHWMAALERDGRMVSEFSSIRYADEHPPLGLWPPLIPSVLPDLDSDESLPEEAIQVVLVYQFKAYLTHRKGLWRRIEIRGDQTLTDLDDVLHQAFGYDWDHLSGFWKLVPRGKGRRYREVDLGTVHPYHDDPAKDRLVAELDLTVGQELKYVYDFGDWVEHRLTLEAVTDPEAEASYPRIVAQNKPRYRYCPTCRAEGRKTVANWICLSCSNDAGKDILVCDDCVLAYHEEHWTEAMLY